MLRANSQQSCSRLPTRVFGLLPLAQNHLTRFRFPVTHGSGHQSSRF
jgi:hypothetical protein